MTYVGDYRSAERDQILESVLVGPITRGTHKFCFQVGRGHCCLSLLTPIGGRTRFRVSSRGLRSWSDYCFHQLLLQVTGVYSYWLLRFERVRDTSMGPFSHSAEHYRGRASCYPYPYLLGTLNVQ